MTGLPSNGVPARVFVAHDAQVIDGIVSLDGPWVHIEPSDGSCSLTMAATEVREIEWSHRPPPPEVAPATTVMETRGGVFVDLLRPDPVRIGVMDIAWHLAHLCRYTGAVRRFYSVAEHTLIVVDRLAELGHNTQTLLAGLHHDDHEAYVGDVASPLKAAIGDRYSAIADGLDSAIHVALVFDEAFWAAVDIDAVRAADEWALACEAWHLMDSRGRGWASDGLYDPLPGGRATWARWWLGHPAESVREEWIARHRALDEQLDQERGREL